MPFILKDRNTSATERMDDLQCDINELENTYRQFSTLNSLISGWRTIYKREIRPRLSRNHSYSLLDIGFGGGDIPIKIAQWASSDGYDLQVIAIDPDPRALDFVQELDRHPKVEFLQCRVSELNPSQKKYDFVISNHLLHHLGHQQLASTLQAAKKLSKISVIFNDICRSDWGYLFFSFFSRPVFRSSFITQDGLTSIKRSYTYEELVSITPKKWKVEKLFPLRLLLKFYHE